MESMREQFMSLSGERRELTYKVDELRQELEAEKKLNDELNVIINTIEH